MAHSLRGDEIASDLVSSRQIRGRGFPVQHVFPELESTHTIDEPDLWDKYDEATVPPLTPRRTSCIVATTHTPRDVCELCQGIFTKEVIFTLHKQPLLYQRYRHHKTLARLYSAACSGCRICSILWMDIMGKDEYVPSFDDQRKFEYLSFTIAKHDECELYYTINFIYKGNDHEWDRIACGRTQICLIPKAAIGDWRMWTFPGYECDSVTKSRVQFAIHCLETCAKQHPKCKPRLAPKTWQPTRLIDLGALGGLLEPKLVQFQSNNPRLCQSYATLSHRWGMANVIKLTTETQKAFSNTIDVNALPKTFQDAFNVVKKLRVRFIWIDSLCIIQDSIEDWQKESAMMADVYQHAEFNVSATGALDSTGGLFPGNKFITDLLCAIELSKSYTWTPGEYFIIKPHLWSSGVSDAPLNQRGWVLQERVLAGRVMHFGKEQLYFECKEMDVCEVFPKGMPNIEAFQTRTLGLASNGRFKRQDPSIDGAWLRQSNSMGRLSSSPEFNAYSLWNELVEAYSRMTLTNQSDKLIAISGIAKHMREVLNDQYIAGLWKTHLPFYLLWTKRKDTPMNTEPMNYIAPTWSWASINEKVTMYPITNSDDERILIDIEAVETYPVTDDDTGQLVGGYIRMRAFLRKCWIARCRLYDNPINSWQIQQSPARLWLDIKNSCTIYVWPDELDNIATGDLVSWNKNSQVYCMPVHVWWKEEMDCCCTEGLILKKVSDDMYMRFGRFKITLANTKDTIAFFGKDPRELICGFNDGGQVPLTSAIISLV